MCLECLVKLWGAILDTSSIYGLSALAEIVLNSALILEIWSLCMKCPHCTVTIHPDFDNYPIYRKGNNLFAKNGNGESAMWSYSTTICPACSKAIIQLSEQTFTEDGDSSGQSESLVLPRAATRPKAPSAVPSELAEDFNEACLVIEDSPKASAALSRRCLQGILRAQGYTQKDLAPAIEALLSSNRLPTELAESVDAIRNVGNFAAHPLKDKHTGEILPVEPHEAEWNLEVLEGLFDYFYVAPAKAQQKKAALNAKLAAANKPPMK